MNKQYLSYEQIEGFVNDIGRDILTSSWRPDYIVGIGRGGLLPATLLSHYLGVPMHTLDISLRDSDVEPTSNCWMAEDAFGYIDKEVREDDEHCSDLQKRKQILIVDDINDSGATIEWLMDDWQKNCLPNDPAWDEIWGNSVRTAFVVHNASSKYQAYSYAGLRIDKGKRDVWIEFSWENWWKAKP